MIEVENLCLDIAGSRILDNVTFKIPENKVVGFLGVNGAGKTSTLDILAGCSRYYKGSIKFDGVELFENEEQILGKVGYLPDEPPLYQDLRVCEYLDYVASLYGLSNKDRMRRSSEMLIKFDLQAVSKKLIGSLSKGFRQRVSLAASLIHNPRYIFLDEPTEGLDPAQIKKIRDLILELKNDHTIFLSSHILSEVESICDHLIVIDNGSIIKEEEFPR